MVFDAKFLVLIVVLLSIAVQVNAQSINCPRGTHPGGKRLRSRKEKCESNEENCRDYE
jgi:hypothetical protein